MTRDEFLRDALGRYLKRKSAPKNLNEEAQREEVRALFRVLTRKAPTSGYESWWEQVETYLGEHAETRAWPDEAEIAKAASSVRVRPLREGAPTNGWVLDPFAINARRIRDGEPVGEDWLFGRQAVELLRKGLVSTTQMQDRRRELRDSLADIYGEEEADEHIAYHMAKHEAAAAMPPDDGRRFRAPRPAVKSLTAAIARPQTPPEHLAPPEPDIETIAARPYTEAEKARMRALRPQADEEARA